MLLDAIEGQFGWCQVSGDHIQTVLRDSPTGNRVIWCRCGKVIVHTLHNFKREVVHDFTKDNIHVECADGAVWLTR